jgi:hypothetical protein
VEKLRLKSSGQNRIRLVTESFDPKLPYVFFKGFDNSRTVYNIKGWRPNNLPKMDDPELLRICALYGTPSGVSSDELTIPDTPVELKLRVQASTELYRHEEADGRSLWLVILPTNIKEVEEHGSDCAEEEAGDLIGNC